MNGSSDAASPPTAAAATTPASVRDVFDDADLWNGVLDVATEAGLVTDEQQAAERLAPYLDAPPAVIADALTLFGLAPGVEELRKRLELVIESGTE